MRLRTWSEKTRAEYWNITDMQSNLRVRNWRSVSRKAPYWLACAYSIGTRVNEVYGMSLCDSGGNQCENDPAKHSIWVRLGGGFQQERMNAPLLGSIAKRTGVILFEIETAGFTMLPTDAEPFSHGDPCDA